MIFANWFSEIKPLIDYEIIKVWLSLKISKKQAKQSELYPLKPQSILLSCSVKMIGDKRQ